MFIIRARNVHQALPMGLDAILAPNDINSVRRESRNGPVIQFREPVTTVYERPTERVLFWPDRDANPFFHLAEGIWMLAGRNDVESMAFYVGNMRNYSDNGKTFHGAYGFRWMYTFGMWQLPTIVNALKKDRTCRRQVLTMWDPRKDLGRVGKDLPCNLQAIFQITDDNRLDMMVTNRSNDMVWGAYGANAVHFSMLQEWVATAVGVPVGRYRQVSANLHIYEDVLEKVRPISKLASMGPGLYNPYMEGQVEPYPLMNVLGTGGPEGMTQWVEEARMYLDDPAALGFKEPFFRKVACPMALAYRAYKKTKGPERFDAALEYLDNVRATDWAAAGREWIARRLDNWKRADDDGVQHENDVK